MSIFLKTHCIKSKYYLNHILEAIVYNLENYIYYKFTFVVINQIKIKHEKNSFLTSSRYVS
jgi:hypothetical protein